MKPLRTSNRWPSAKFLLRMCFSFVAALWAAGPMTAGPQESPAKGDVEKLIRQSGANIAIAFRALDGSQELFIQADKPYHAASTMKIPVMIELYAQAQAGQLKLSDPIMVHNSFRSIVDGSIYRLDPSDDSDEDVYKAIGGTMTLQDLCAHMITRSSNLAANLLIERLGVDKIREQIDALHANGMDFLRGVEDGKAFEKGRNNMTTARALLNLLWALAKGEAVDPAASEAMVGVLARSEFHEAIPAGLPEGTRIAHKTGEITGIHHDASIVYGPHPFILVIMVEGITDREKSSQVMALIAHSLASALQ